MSFSRVTFFFFNDTATTEIYTLSLHDALPIAGRRVRAPFGDRREIGGVPPGDRLRSALRRRRLHRRPHDPTRRYHPRRPALPGRRVDHARVDHAPLAPRVARAA